MANMRKHLVATVAIVASPALGGCVGTTGSGLVDFDAFASGPSDASGAPGTKHAYTFLSPYTGYTITLETAMLQIGAVYLDATPCNGSSEVTSCVDQNAETVAQVNGGELGAYGVPMSGVLVDALSPEPQSFIGQGSGIVQAAGSAEVWLVAPDSLNGSNTSTSPISPRRASVAPSRSVLIDDATAGPCHSSRAGMAKPADLPDCGGPKATSAWRSSARSRRRPL